jgi:nitroreductase
MNLAEEGIARRKAEHEIDEIFLGRWSPRAMAGEPLPDDELMSLFEAARWAPSSYNCQPWRFLYATRDSDHWDTFLNLLGEFNQGWCKSAGVLVVVLSKKTFEHNGKPARTHSFDAGSAWMSLALEASRRGIVAHGMEGFDYDRARKELNVPDDYVVECMIAIGRQAPKDTLPKQLQEREEPSGRKHVAEIIFEGPFSG